MLVDTSLGLSSSPLFGFVLNRLPKKSKTVQVLNMSEILSNIQDKRFHKHFLTLSFDGNFFLLGKKKSRKCLWQKYCKAGCVNLFFIEMRHTLNTHLFGRTFLLPRSLAIGIKRLQYKTSQTAREIQGNRT